MNYRWKLKEAFYFTQKYQFLWILGFIATFCASITNLGFNLNTGASDPNLQAIHDQFSLSRFSIIERIVIFIVLILISVALHLVGWYFGSIATGGIIKSVHWNSLGEKFTLKKALSFGRTRALKLMAIDFLGFIILSPFFVLMLLINNTSNSGAFGVLFICLCLSMPFLIILLIYWTIVSTITIRYIVIKDFSVGQSLKSGYKLANRAILKFVAAYLVGCLAIFVPLMLLLTCPLLTWLTATSASIHSRDASVYLLVALGGVVIFNFFSAIIKAPFTVFTESYLTKVTMEMMEQYEPISDKEA